MRAVRALVGNDVALCNIVCFAGSKMHFTLEKLVAVVGLKELEAFLASIEAEKPVTDSALKLAWAKLEGAAKKDGTSRRLHAERPGAEGWRGRAPGSLWFFNRGAGALVAAYCFRPIKGYFFY